MRRNPMQPRRQQQSGGFTLVEMLLVIGIIIMMLTLILVSINSMLRNSRMSRTISMLIAAMDECRTTAITERRTTRMDLTRLDPEGGNNRLTVYGSAFNDNFENYKMEQPTPAKPNPPQDPALLAEWKCTKSDEKSRPRLQVDTSRSLRISGVGGACGYWNPGARVEAVKQDYFEAVLQARVKILQGQYSNQLRVVSLMGAIDDGGGGGINEGYRLSIIINPNNHQTAIQLERGGLGEAGIVSGSGEEDGEAKVIVDQASGENGATHDIVEGVWYRMLLSIKIYKVIGDAGKKAILAGSVWPDGLPEPLKYTVGPITDNAPLENGFGGVQILNCNGLVDDIVFDLRPVRPMPVGIRIDAMDPTNPGEIAKENTAYSFPIKFRGNGGVGGIDEKNHTNAAAILRLRDVTSGFTRFIRIDQISGRTRVGNSWDEISKK